MTTAHITPEIIVGDCPTCPGVTIQEIRQVTPGRWARYCRQCKKEF